MSNEENIIPHRFTSDQDREAARRNGRKGAAALAEKRRRQKDAKQMLAILAEMPASSKAKKTLDAFVPGLADEDMTNAALAAMGQLKAAISGSTKAFDAIQDAMDRDAKKAAAKSDYTIPPLDFTADFVEPYRIARAALDGKNGVREIVSRGGRGSAKSNFWSAFAYETMMRDRMAHVVFTRRYKSDLRDSVYTQFERTVRRCGDPDEWEFTTAPMKAVYKPTGQTVLFVGCDKPIGLKSKTVPFGYVKLLIHEEADEMAGVEQMDSTEDTFLRSDTAALDIKIFNPPRSKNNFMNAYAAEKRNDPATLVCDSSFKAVPVEWLGERFFERAAWFEKNRPDYYRNNYLGEVVGTGGELFGNVVEREITDEEIDGIDVFYQGLDFGFEHPQAFVRVAYDRENDSVTVLYERVERHARLDGFAQRIEADLPDAKRNETICDSANPDKIADMYEMGFEVCGAVKRWKGGGRDYAWEWLRTVREIVIDPERTPHLAKELRTLEFEQLRDGTYSSRYPDLGEDAVMATVYALNRVIIGNE